MNKPYATAVQRGKTFTLVVTNKTGKSKPVDVKVSDLSETRSALESQLTKMGHTVSGSWRTNGAARTITLA